MQVRTALCVCLLCLVVTPIGASCTVSNHSNALVAAAQLCNGGSCPDVQIVGNANYAGSGAEVVSLTCRVFSPIGAVITMNGPAVVSVIGPVSLTITNVSFVGGGQEMTTSVFDMLGTYASIILHNVNVTGVKGPRGFASLSNNLVVTNSTFHGCESTSTYGSVFTVNGHVAINDSVFAYNTASNVGDSYGVLYCDYSGASTRSVVIERTVFEGNLAASTSSTATALAVVSSTNFQPISIVDCVIVSASSLGGSAPVAYLQYGSLTVVRSEFRGSVSMVNTGADFEDSALYSMGYPTGALALEHYLTTITRSTVTGADGSSSVVLISGTGALHLFDTYVVESKAAALECTGANSVQTYKSYICNAPQERLGCTINDTSPQPILPVFNASCDVLCTNALYPCPQPDFPDPTFTNMSECVLCGTPDTTGAPPTSTTVPSSSVSTSALGTTTTPSSTNTGTSDTATTSSTTAASTNAPGTTVYISRGSDNTTSTSSAEGDENGSGAPGESSKDEGIVGKSNNDDNKGVKFPLAAILGVVFVGLCVVGSVSGVGFLLWRRQRGGSEGGSSSKLTESELESVGPPATSFGGTTRMTPNPAHRVHDTDATVRSDSGVADETFLSLEGKYVSDVAATVGSPAQNRPPMTMRTVRLADATEVETQLPVGGATQTITTQELLISVDEAITEMKMDDPLVKRVKYLGSGTFGDVSLYKWNYINVAVKVVKNVTADSVQDFVEEAQTLAQLRCPYCVSYAGICLEPLAIVTEYMPGGDLYEFLKEQPSVCTPEKCVEIVRDIAAGLAFLHSQGIAHRDLKPANILLTKYYEAKLADFGLSGDKEASMDGAGTPMYAAPEIFMRQTGTLASDIYSFGVIIIEVLGGVRPFSGNALVRKKALETPPADFNTLTLPHPDRLMPLVQSMVAFEPSERPDIGVVLDVLDEVFGE